MSTLSVDNKVSMMSKNAKKIVESRYLVSEFGEKDWSDVCRRVARFITAAELYYTSDIKAILQFENQLYQDMVSRKFIFNSPTLFNAGLGIDKEVITKPLEQMTLNDYQTILDQKNSKNMLSACFYLTVENSIHEIYSTLKAAALISKVGGGVGFNFSKLSHQDRPLDSGIGKASGPLSFIHLFNESGKTVYQGGRRRGAFLATLNVDHPDIEQFIHAKDGDDALTYFNISVLVNDDFMKRVKNHQSWDLVDPVTGEAVKTYSDANELFDQIVHSAWKRGDPGLLFFDTINRDAFITGKDIIGCNPCSEIPTYDKNACNLGHINLNALTSEDGDFDYNQMMELAARGVCYLDNVIDMCWYPLPEIDAEVKKYRPIGLGVMGFAHSLLKMGMKYGEGESIDFAFNLSLLVMLASNIASSELAKTRKPYPAFFTDSNKWARKNTSQICSGILLNGYLNHLKKDRGFNLDKKWFQDKDYLNFNLFSGVRNATVNTIAPTGTVSLIADTSSGMEPVFALIHDRKYLDENGQEKVMEVVDPLLALWKEEHPGEPFPDYFVDAGDIHYEKRIAIQSAFQDHIDTGISSTVNLSHDATVDDVRNIYLLAHQRGCKGITVFRDGCKNQQVLYRKGDAQSEAIVLPEQVIHPTPRPITTYGSTTEYKIGCGTLYVTINTDENGRIIETFITSGRGGGCKASSEGLSRMISIALRSGVAVEDVIKQISGIRCPACMKKSVEVLSCPDAVARELKSIVDHSANKVIVVQKQDEPRCPDCGGLLQNKEGCLSCDCGWSKCS